MVAVFLPSTGATEIRPSSSSMLMVGGAGQERCIAVVRRVVVLDEIADVDGLPPPLAGETLPRIDGRSIGQRACVGRGNGHPCHHSGSPRGTVSRRMSSDGQIAPLKHPPPMGDDRPVGVIPAWWAGGDGRRFEALIRASSVTLRPSMPERRSRGCPVGHMRAGVGHPAPGPPGVHRNPATAGRPLRGFRALDDAHVGVVKPQGRARARRRGPGSVRYLSPRSISLMPFLSRMPVSSPVSSMRRSMAVRAYICWRVDTSW